MTDGEETKTVPAEEVASEGEEEELAPRKSQVVFVLGGPGAGKGTQCMNVVRRMRGWATLSAGDLLRACRKDNPESEEAKVIEAKVAAGEIVPVAITIKLLMNEMERLSTQKRGRRTKFLIDGFPRNMDNVTGWEEHVGDKADVRGVLYFQVPEEEMIKRVKERAEKAKAENPDAARDDDDEETLMKRLKTNLELCEPIVKMYKEKKENFVHEIDGSQKINTVWREVQKKIRQFEKEIKAAYPPPPRKNKGEGKQGTASKGSGKGAKSRTPKWIKIEAIDPNTRRTNFYAKVIKSSPNEKLKEMFDVQVGDETAVVTATLSKQRVEEVATDGEIVRFQNCSIRMINNFIRVEVDKWGLLKKASEPFSSKKKEAAEGEEGDDAPPEVPSIDKVNTEKDISAIEFEAVPPEETGASRGRGSGRRSGTKGKGKGKKGKGKSSKGGNKGEKEKESASKDEEKKGAGKRRRRGGRKSGGAGGDDEGEKKSADKKKEGTESETKKPRKGRGRKSTESTKSESAVADKKEGEKKKKGAGKKERKSEGDKDKADTDKAAKAKERKSEGEKSTTSSTKKKGKGKKNKEEKKAEE